MFVMGNSDGVIKTFEVWVQNQFHKDVEFKALSLVSSDRFRKISPIDSTKLKWGFPDHTDWIIPIEFDGLTLGQIKIKEGMELNEPSLSRIFHFVDLSLAPQLYKQHLDLKVSNLETPAHESRKESIFSGVVESFEKEDFSQLAPAMMVLTGKESFRFRKIAFEIKQKFDHLIAFVDFKDVASEMKTTADFWQLSHICLYLESNSLQSQRTLDLLQVYLKEVQAQPQRERPLLVIGCENIDQIKGLSVELQDSPLLQTIHIDRWPLLEGDLRKVLDLILD